MVKHEYPNTPQVGVGAIVIKNNKILLIKRGIPPSKGLWAIPGGCLELGETLPEAAEREIKEETGINIQAKHPVYTFDIIYRDDEGNVQWHYVVVDFLADYISGEPKGADDAVDARWLAWEELKEMPVSQNTLKVLKAVQFGH